MPASKKRNTKNLTSTATTFNNLISSTNDISNKPLDNFFGVDLDKPPSPVPESSSHLSQSSQTKSLQSLDNLIPQDKLTHYNLTILDNANNIVNTNTNANTNIKNGNIVNTNTIVSLSLTDIKNKMEQLTDNELFEIFKIIKNNNEKYSTNKSWILVNLSTLKSSTIKDITNFLVFCDNNNKIINEEEHTRDLYRDLVSA